MEVTIIDKVAFTLKFSIYFGLPSAFLEFSGDTEYFPNNTYSLNGHVVDIDPKSDCVQKLKNFKRRGGGWVLYESSKITIISAVFNDSDTLSVRFSFTKEKYPETVNHHVAHLLRV